MKSDDIDRMVEEMATNKISERTREFAIQSGLSAPYGTDREGLRDFDYRKFAELVRADEREACAKVCEELGIATNGMHERNHECAQAIRARGEK